MNSRLLKMLCITGALLSSSVFAQQNKNKDMGSGNGCVSSKTAPDYALPDSVPAGVNMPASMKINGGWDLEIDGSFIYWYVSQEYMDIGRSATYQPGGATPALPKGQIISQGFNYEPGFKVGLEFNTRNDDWMIRADYTWLHFEKQNTFGTVPASNTVATGQKVYIPNDWFNNYSTGTQKQAIQMKSKWKMHLDMADLTMSRPFYQGRNLVVMPYGGLRGLWIRQVFHITAVNATNPAIYPAESTNRSQCWGVGPTTGASARYLVGCGFRFEGSMGFSLLYNRFINLSHREKDQLPITGIIRIDGDMDPISLVRPVAEMGLGLGWGTYFYRNNYHVDFSATYDFTLFWSQNMMRQTVSAFANNSVGYVDPAGDLMMQGLTVNARFDF